MTHILEQLREEHRRVQKLLLVLEEELALFDRLERPDYDVLQAAVAFLQDYSARCHDPKERVVFDALRVCDPEAAAMLGGLEIEHAQDAGRLQRLSRGLNSIVSDRDVPRQAFHDAVRDFVAHVRHQIDFEERVLFPAALKALQPEDWAEIDMQAGKEGSPSRQAQLQALGQSILEWEAGNRAAA
jgi:hemerythrin-like domain-containing protein